MSTFIAFKVLIIIATLCGVAALWIPSLSAFSIVVAINALCMAVIDAGQDVTRAVRPRMPKSDHVP